MRPGSSDRCKVTNGTGLRCHLRIGHDSPHQAPRGKATVRWAVVTKRPVTS